MSSTPLIPNPHRAGAWGGVFALALGAFALVSSEFMPVSLLTPVAADLQVSEGQAGQAITISGAFALLTSLSIAALSGRLDRKWLLVGLTLLMVLSGTVAAFAPNYVAFMAGRALIGVAIGGFWSLSAATAIRLVPTDQVPRALGIVNGGNALATVLAAPLGALLASVIGWRWAMFSVVPVAAVALVWKLAVLPSMKPVANVRSRSIVGLLKDRRVVVGMVAVSVFFTGQFTLFTYLRPFLETVTGVGARTLSLLLLVIGVSGFVGTLLIGPLLKTGLYRILMVIPLLMAGIAIALPWLGTSIGATGVLLAVWGLVAPQHPLAGGRGWPARCRTTPKPVAA